MVLSRLTPEEFSLVVGPHLETFLADRASDSEASRIDRTQCLSDLYDLVHGRSKLDWAMAERGSQGPLKGDVPTPCVIAVVGVAISCVGLVIQAAGVPSSVSRVIAATAVEGAMEAEPALEATLQAEVTALMNAKGPTDQAKAVFALFGSITNVVSIGDIVTAIKDQLSWYQWVLMGVVAAAQLTIWFTTGGTAAIAELILFGGALAQLVIAAQQAYATCNPAAVGARLSPQPGAFVAIDVGQTPLAMLESGQLYELSDDGTWTDTGRNVEDFSTQLPIQGAPPQKLWTIAPNGEADGVISYLDVATGQQVQTNGVASLISSGDDGDTWAVRADHTILRFYGDEWKDQPGTVNQIAVSHSGLQWALSEGPAQQSVVLNRVAEGNWQLAASAPEATDILQMATNSAGDLVCVTTDNRAFQYLDEGSTWAQLGGGDLLVEDVCIRDVNNSWIIDSDGQAQAIGPLLNPSCNPGRLEWDTEDVWDETKSTHLYIVNRAAQLAGTGTTPGFADFINSDMQPFVGKDEASKFRQGLCQGIYDADFLPAFNNPNWLTQPTWKSHFYDPATGQNYMGETTPTALTNGALFLATSVAQFRPGPFDAYTAGYNLGLALHYFTDLTQPMHAANYTYLSSFPFGYHTDFEVYVMAQQAAVTPQPTVTNFMPGPDKDVQTHFTNTASGFKQNYFSPIEKAHLYATWKWSPAQWQAAVLPLVPQILNDAVQATAQLLYLYFCEIDGIAP